MEANKIIITGGATRMGAAIARKLSGPNKEILIHYNKSKSKAESLKKELEKNGTKSKTGLYTLTKTSAMSLAPNIRVNGIAPGPTIKNQRQTDKHFKKQYLATPLKRQVDVDQICNAVDFFIKNRSITGQVLAIDSGQNLNWQTPDVIGKE
jgi:NAD(P)-dependent dehydrogenase (short-subunit alcohol dehydrogenase family)